jgi:hypothetical protein
VGRIGCQKIPAPAGGGNALVDIMLLMRSYPGRAGRRTGVRGDRRLGPAAEIVDVESAAAADLEDAKAPLEGTRAIVHAAPRQRSVRETGGHPGRNWVIK